MYSLLSDTKYTHFQCIDVKKVQPRANAGPLQPPPWNCVWDKSLQFQPRLVHQSVACSLSLWLICRVLFLFFKWKQASNYLAKTDRVLKGRGRWSYDVNESNNENFIKKWKWQENGDLCTWAESFVCRHDFKWPGVNQTVCERCDGNVAPVHLTTAVRGDGIWQGTGNVFWGFTYSRHYRNY